jgi:hypothetical protein
MPKALAVFALFGILVAAGCGELTKDPLEGLNFQAPGDWESIGILGVHIFASPDEKQFIMVDSMPADVDAVKQEWNSPNIRNPRNFVQRDIKICGTTSAHYAEALVYFAKTFQDMNGEMVTVRRGDETLVATYLDLPGQPPDKKAEAAIYELCPASGPK